MRGRIIGEGERMKPHALYREEVGICTREDAKTYCNPDELIEIDIAVDPAKALTSSLTVKTAQWQFWLLRRWFIRRARFLYEKAGSTTAGARPC